METTNQTMPPPVAAPLNYQTPSTERVRVGFPMRLVAAVIDCVIAGVANGIIALVIGLVIAGWVGRICGLLVVMAYFAMEVVKAQSVGKMLFKFSITRQDGSPATQDQLIKRYAYKMAPTALMILAALPIP